MEPFMLSENVVLEVSLTHEGKEHKAPYFFENGVIHANIIGKNMRLPHGRAPVEQTVRAVLIGMLERQARLAYSLTGYRTMLSKERNAIKHVRLL
jgi:hypothetical protein